MEESEVISEKSSRIQNTCKHEVDVASSHEMLLWQNFQQGKGCSDVKWEAVVLSGFNPQAAKRHSLSLTSPHYRGMGETAGGQNKVNFVGWDKDLIGLIGHKKKGK